MHNEQKIKLNFQIEISSNCNSKCHGCNRYINNPSYKLDQKNKMFLNPTLKVGKSGLMPFDIFKQVFSSEKLNETMGKMNLMMIL